MKKVIVTVFTFLLTYSFLINTTYAKWAYAFVVYDGGIYVVSEIHIEPNKIGKKIGEVTHYSDQEGDYGWNFSNEFSKGTEYYTIMGITSKKAIAIKNSKNNYIRAEYEGNYNLHKKYIMKEVLIYFIGFGLLTGLIYFFFKKRKSSSLLK